MLEVRGFRGVRYNPDVVGPLDDVITPPFDVIGPEERRQLAARNPHNMVHLILPEARDGRDPYESAGHHLTSWLDSGAMLQDEEETFYLLEQSFRGPDGASRVRRGFFAVARIPEDGEDTVLGHERTFRHKIEDRLRLTAATQANLGAVFVLYEDPDGVLAPFLETMDSRPEDYRAQTFEGTQNRVWRVPHDPRVTEFFRNRRLYIADGHHRFATACEHRRVMREREKPDGPREYDYVLMGFVAFQDPGLMIYPTHRVLDLPEGFELESFLKRLEPTFEVRPVSGNLLAETSAEPGCALGMAVGGGKQYLLRLRPEVDRAEYLGSDRGPAWRNLDVAVLHRGIIERALGHPEGAEFVYEIDAEKSLAMVESGEKGVAFLLKPMVPEQVRDCAEAREPMPQKATYFYPKLPSGAVIHRLI